MLICNWYNFFFQNLKKQIMKKVILWIFGGLLFLLLALILFVQFTWDKKFEAPYPKINVSQDSAVIARGQYLVYGPAHCATCHVPSERMAEIDEGKIVWEFHAFSVT